MNILFGMPVIRETGGFTGAVEIGGEPVVAASPAAAMELGIGRVHQEFMLIPGFTIWENVKLNRERLRDTWVSGILGRSLDTLDVPRMRADARAALSRIALDPETARQVVDVGPAGRFFLKRRIVLTARKP